MAKKRGVISPLGNTAGSHEAQKSAAKANLESLTRQLNTELENAGENTQAFLQRHFGVESVGQPVIWTLASGQTATFTELALTYEQVKNDTVVAFDVNGRDQSLLTKESLLDLNSLSFQQFYPAVGREIDGKIDILDGSRRRAWFLLQPDRVSHFRVLVTQDDVSLSDAKALAKQLQTAKEHNQREIGLQCKALMDSESCTQEQVANLLGMSRQAVGRAIKAANIDAALIALFPVVNELSHTDYSVLDKVMKTFQNNSLSLFEFINKIEQKLADAQLEPTLQSTKEWLIKMIKSDLKVAVARQASDSEDVTVTTLKPYSSKGMFARKRVKGRNFSYEFGRLPKSLQQALDKAIANVLDDHQEI